MQTVPCKHPENSLVMPEKHPENTLNLPFCLTFRVFFPIPFAGIPFRPTFGGVRGTFIRNVKSAQRPKFFGRTSLRTSGQKLRSGPPNPGETSILARTCRADVHEKTSVWKTSGWFFVPYFRDCNHFGADSIGAQLGNYSYSCQGSSWVYLVSQLGLPASLLGRHACRTKLPPKNF